MSDANSPLFRFKMWQAGLPPTLRWLLTLNIALYVVFVLLSIVGQAGLLAWLTLPAQPAALVTRPWSLLTYPFANLYGGFFGLLSFAFAMLWLNWLGRDYEESYGSYRLLGLAVFSILGGAALALALGAFLPSEGGMRGLAGLGGIGYFGAWGIATGVLVGVATVHPDREMGLFLLGVVPLKWIAIGFVVLDLAFVRDPTHLGAAIAAFGFGRAQRSGVDLAAWARPIYERSPKKKKASRSSPVSWPSGRGEAALRRVETAELQRSQRPHDGGRRASAPSRPGPADVDRILDKILAEGYDSLTADEKRTLAEASRD